MLLVKFFVEFIHFVLGFQESAFSGRSDLIEPPSPSLDSIEGRAEKAGAFKSMQQRIEGSRTNPITVVLQFLHHGEPEDRLMYRVQEHVNSNQAVEEFASLICHGHQYTSAKGHLGLTVIEIRYNVGSRWRLHQEFFPAF